MKRVAADIRLAFAFLTRLPAGDVGPVDAARLSRASAWFPLVGVFVGGVSAGALLLAGVGLPPGPATVIALLAAVLATGGFHEDGLADVADAAGAHVSRERKLEILTDPRVGTYGALAVAFPLLFALTCLIGLDEGDAAAALVCAHVLGRWTTLPASRLLPLARAEGKGSLVRSGAGALMTGSAFTAAVVILVSGDVWLSALCLAATCAVIATGAVILQRVFGGISGDGYGAINKVTELAVYGCFAGWLA